MNRSAVDAGELRDPPAHVRAGRVVALRLTRGVEHPVRARVRPGPGHPLPVAAVVRDVAVDEQVGEVGGARAPVQVQVLREKRRGDEAGAVVHESFLAQLSHPRVDERIARAAVLPCRECGPRRRASDRLAAACPRARVPAGPRRAGSGSRASRAGGRTPLRRHAPLPARRPRAARDSRTEGTATAVRSSRRRGRPSRSRRRRVRLRATRRAELARPSHHPREGPARPSPVTISARSGTRPESISGSATPRVARARRVAAAPASGSSTA